MPLQIHILTSSGHLRPHERAIRSALEAAWPAIDDALALTDLDVVVSHDTHVIPETGDSGYCPSGHQVQLWCDAGRHDVDMVVAERLPVSLAHEAHHARRWRGPGYGSTLWDALITEGLAQHFERELYGRRPVTAARLPAGELTELLPALEADLDRDGYDHRRWFLSEDASMPRWAGYRIGYHLIRRHLAGHPGATSASLCDAPSAHFRPSWTAALRDPGVGTPD